MRVKLASVREYPASVVAALCALLFAAALPQTDLGEGLELRTHDVRFIARGPRATDAPLVIADIDDETERAWQDEPVAFWGEHYAHVLQAARQLGARAVGMDVVPSVSADDYLEQVGATPKFRPDMALARALQNGGGSIVLSSVLAPTRPVVPISRFRLLPETENRLSFANLPLSPDGVARRASLFLLDEQKAATNVPPSKTVLPSLPALLAVMAGDFSNASDSFEAVSRRAHDADALRVLAGGRSSPNRWRGDVSNDGALARPDDLPERTEAEEGFWINYTGTDLPHISARLLERWATEPQSVTTKERTRLNRLRGALVLVGVSFAGSKDVHPAPLGATNRSSAGSISGVTVQAQALATLLDHRPLWRLSPTREVALTVLAGCITLLLAAGLMFGSGLLALLVLCTGAAVTAFLVFAYGDGLLPVVGPGFALVVPWLVFHAARSVEETTRRLVALSQFGRYVSPQIRDYVLQDPAHARPGGVMRDATILFLDMRGSTVYGEKKNPVTLLDDLNEFFGVIVPIVERENGLLYRYTGDGFLAVFGAPQPAPEEQHPRAALTAATQIALAVQQVGAERQERGLMPWRMGCSVHTGPVAAGNLGTEDRPDFTVIGDAVNLCAKMEEGNKGHCSDIVVSDITLARLRPAPDANPVLPPGLPPPFLTEAAIIGKRTTPTLLHYFCLPGETNAPSRTQSGRTTSTPAVAQFTGVRAPFSEAVTKPALSHTMRKSGFRHFTWKPSHFCCCLFFLGLHGPKRIATMYALFALSRFSVWNRKTGVGFLLLAALAGQTAPLLARQANRKPTVRTKSDKSARPHTAATSLARPTGQMLAVSGVVQLIEPGKAGVGVARSLEQFRPGDRIEVLPGASATVILYNTAQRFRLSDTSVEVTTGGLRHLKGKEPVALRSLSAGLVRALPVRVGTTFSLNAAAMVVRDANRLHTETAPGRLRCLGPMGGILPPPDGEEAGATTLRWQAPPNFVPTVSVVEFENQARPVFRDVLEAGTTHYELPTSKLKPGVLYVWRVQGELPADEANAKQLTTATALMRRLTPDEAEGVTALVKEAQNTERGDETDATPEITSLGVYLQYGLFEQAVQAGEAARQRRPDDHVLEVYLRDIRAQTGPRVP